MYLSSFVMKWRVTVSEHLRSTAVDPFKADCNLRNKVSSKL
jgi:hypothetical protein